MHMYVYVIRVDHEHNCIVGKEIFNEAKDMTSQTA